MVNEPTIDVALFNLLRVPGVPSNWGVGGRCMFLLGWGQEGPRLMAEKQISMVFRKQVFYRQGNRDGVQDRLCCHDRSSGFVSLPERWPV